MIYMGNIIIQGTELDRYELALIGFGIVIVLFVSMIIYYKFKLFKTEQYIQYMKDQAPKIPDVSHIAKKIEAELQKTEPKVFNFEDEQEHKAIISYEELLKKERPLEFLEMLEPAPKMEKTEEVISFVPEDVKEQAIKEKPVVKDNQEFLNSLVNLRNKLK